jgi:hypothetical protein
LASLQAQGKALGTDAQLGPKLKQNGRPESNATARDRKGKENAAQSLSAPVVDGPTLDRTNRNPTARTGKHKRVSELSRKNHRPISTQSPVKSDQGQEHEKVVRRENRRFVRARVDLVQLTIRIASTHVIAQINAKRTTQNGLKSTNQATKEEGKKEREEYEEHHKHNSKIESRRTRGGKGHHSHLINSDSTRVMDLSLTSN